MNYKDIMIHYIISEEGDPEFLTNVHTHGLEKANHLNLMTVLALPQETVSSVLNSLADRIGKGERFDEEKIYTDILEDDYPVQIVRLYMGKEEIAVLLLPDEEKRLPRDKDCCYPYNMQLDYIDWIKEHHYGED